MSHDLRTVGAASRYHKPAHVPIFSKFAREEKARRGEAALVRHLGSKAGGSKSKAEIEAARKQYRAEHKDFDYYKGPDPAPHIAEVTDLDKQINMAELIVRRWVDVAKRAKEEGCTEQELLDKNWNFLKEHAPKVHAKWKRAEEYEKLSQEEKDIRREKESNALTTRMKDCKERRASNPNGFFNFDFMDEKVVTPLRRRIQACGRGYAKVLNFSYAKANSKNPDHIYVYYKQHSGDRSGEYVGKITPGDKFVIGFKLPTGVTPAKVETALQDCLYGMYDYEKAQVANHFTQ